MKTQPVDFESIRSAQYPAVTASPYIRTRTSTRRIMMDVLIALTPAVLGSLFFFGIAVLPHYALSILTAVTCDLLIQQLRRKAPVFDASAIVTGTLLAMSLPVSAPVWFGPLGALIGICAAKELFGGIGRNFLNPALAGRAVLRLAFASQMTQSPLPVRTIAPALVDTVSGATPLRMLQAHLPLSGDTLWASFLGDTAGKLGETSALLLLLGVGYLLIRGVIRFRIPLGMLASMALMAWIFGGSTGLFSGGLSVVLGHLLGGATILGGFFMATDYGSSPSAPLAQWIFGVTLGVVIMLFRFFSGYPEGFTFAALLVNCTVPLLNRVIRPRVLGEA